MDEMTQYAYEVTRTEKGKFVLVTKKSAAKVARKPLTIAMTINQCS
jgi:hypothetical protein